MDFDLALRALVVTFPAVEVVIAVGRRARSGIARHADQGSMRVLWLVISLSVAVAVMSQWIPGVRLPAPRGVVKGLALFLLATGLALRWVSIWSLGRFFTVDVAIHEGHRLVDRGVYRYIRHPSYTGLMMAFAGLALFFGNWVSLLVLIGPIGLALLLRIKTEETALLEGLGPPYAAYCARTERLIPGIY